MAEGMKKLSDEELEQASGAVIIRDNNMYLVVSEDGNTICPPAWASLHDAQLTAVEVGWSPVYITLAEYEQRFGHKFSPSHFYEGKDGFWYYSE